MGKTKKILTMLLALAMVFSMAACGGGEAEKPGDDQAAGPEVKGEIILATTTSTKDSGLLDYVLPDFTAKTGWAVKTVSVGSGEAMAMGEAGEADVLLVHSPGAEKDFVANGHADADGRFNVMYNDFVLVGPADDPAGVAAFSADAVSAFKAISEKNATFISRADDSGTHKKELSIWEKATITPKGDWYVEAAAGMGAVITMADEKLGYTLADRATWLTVGSTTELQLLCENDPSGVLYNQYGVICVNPEKNDKINVEGAKDFQKWILSPETQKLIGGFGVEEYGKALFVPNGDAK